MPPRKDGSHADDAPEGRVRHRKSSRMDPGVVCKCRCRKATKLYCFVHKVPVCGECICFPEHQICVVRTYSEWVIDGDYNWPPKCCHCQAELAEGTDPQTTRFGCLHVMHTNCLVSHIKSFPPHTAPARYTCPACSTSIWLQKSGEDSGSRLHTKLKEAILQTLKSIQAMGEAMGQMNRQMNLNSEAAGKSATLPAKKNKDQGDRDELNRLREQVEDLKKQLSEKDELLKSHKNEISDAKITLEKFSWNDDFDVSNLNQNHDLDSPRDVEELEAAREAYIAAVAIAKEKLDEESIAAAATAKFYLKSLYTNFIILSIP